MRTEQSFAARDVIDLRFDRNGTAARRFEPVVNAAAAARAFVRDALVAGGADTMCDVADLIVGELAANAIAHAGTDFIVRVEWHDGRVRLCVRDFDGTAPASRYAGARASSGRGLHMIDATAERWGSDSLPDGKVVWAELIL